ncbi:hypothetical protein DCAR_0727976 [Daucus carota subsp. sativus]|uniref:RING-type domain-containing protein n=1 Tax=Daucus carota subsp. sativus TaxID=79200 RepID=A0AAF0XI76_DAUCS|nr:hypothetical protein DCAR_0727976 [Daucus carota subsp. sativus]
MSFKEIGPGDAAVKKRTFVELLTCRICDNICKDPVNITECLHIFCNRCITKKIQEEDLNSCPECKVYLGCVPLDKIRPDHNWNSIREALFPSLGKAEQQDDEQEYKESEPSNGEAEQPNSLPGRRKQKSLSSLENKINVSAGSATRIQNPQKLVGRRRKSIARKAFSSAGSAIRIQNPKKSAEAHSQSKKISMDLKNCIEDDKQSSEQQIPPIGREKTQRSDKKVELVNNLLKPLDDIAEAGKVMNINKTFSEGDLSSKVIDISDSEGKSSEKNLKSYNAEGATKSTPPSLPTLRPVRKNRGRPKKAVEPQGLVSAQTIVDAVGSHARGVAPVWLSLVSSVNQEGVEPLPQIPPGYLMIKNGTQSISFINKYLVQKLGLNREDEVEISLWGMRLPHDLKLHQLIDMWSQTMSDSVKFPTVVGDYAEEFVMVLTYGPKHPQQ